MSTDLEKVQSFLDKSSDLMRRGFHFSKKYTKKSLELTKNSALKAKRLTDRERFQLSKLQEFLDSAESTRVSDLIKQGKARIEIKRQGWSFLISSKDLLPKLIYIPPSQRKLVLDSTSAAKDRRLVTKLGKKVEDAFYAERFKEFSERSWGFIPQYIAPTLVTPVHLKQAIAMQLFCPEKFKLLILGTRTKNKLLTSAQELDATLIVTDIDKIKAKHRSKVLLENRLLVGAKEIGNKASTFNLVLPFDNISMKKFTDLVENLVVQEVKINKRDIEFIQRYVSYAQTINPKVPQNLTGKIKSFAVNLKKKNKKLNQNNIEGIIKLAKASARMELRNMIELKDLDRAFRLVREANKDYLK